MSVMAYRPPRNTNIVGNIALVLAVLGGIAGAIAVFVAPIAIFFVFGLLIAALVLSIIGLTKRFAPKATSIIALVLSAVLGVAAPAASGIDNVLYLLQPHPSAHDVSEHMMDYATVSFPILILVPKKQLAEAQKNFDIRAQQIVDAGPDCADTVRDDDGRGMKIITREACRWYLRGGSPGE